MAVSLYRYTWVHTKRQQLWMLFVVLLSILPLFLSLNLPKLIVNGPIQGEGFEKGAATTHRYLDLVVPLPKFLDPAGGVTLFGGIDLDRLQALYVLSGLFLALVIVNGAFKYYLNTYKGRLGERMLRRMRYEFVEVVLRFPIMRFRQLRSPEVASMIKDELEPIGGFIGDAVVQPVYLMSQVITSIVFIFVQSFTLGMVAMGVMGIQVVLIPRMRRRLLVLGRQRQLTARQFAGRVGEIVEGIASVHTNDTSNFERAGVSEELGRIFLIRFDIYQWKFLVKFLNNFLSQVTPFIFYLFGGYFAITGQLDIGQLVAVINAYKELPSPLKDLIDWDQTRLDVTVKYEQVVEQFDVDNVLDTGFQSPVMERVPPLAAGFVLTSVGVQDEADGRLLEEVTLDLPLGEKVAAVGAVGEGGEYVAEVMARLRPPSVGQIVLADQPLQTLHESITGRRVAYVEATTYFPRTTLRDALLYGLKHYPVVRAEPDNSTKQMLSRHETRKSGNTTLDIADGWIDYEDIGLKSEEELGGRVADILKLVGLERDVQLFGLRTRVPPEFQEEVAGKILEARKAFRENLAEAGLDSHVEPFDVDRYIVNATIMENIAFGAPVDPRLGLAQFYVDPHARKTLRETGLASMMFEIGRDIAATMIDLFGDLEAGNPLLQRISVMTPEELGEYRQVVMRVAGRGFDEAGEAERVALIRLALSYVEPRHRLGLIDEDFMERVVAARKLFREGMPEELAAVIVLHEAEAFNSASSIQDNVLFGRIALDRANAADVVESLLLRSLEELDLAGIVQEAGLSYDIGAGAKRLSLGQQQKLALARSLLKAPDYLIVNRGLSALDHESQARIIEGTLELASDPEHPFGTFWVLASTQHVGLFDRVVQFKGGRISSDEKTVDGHPAAPVVAEAEEEEEEESAAAEEDEPAPVEVTQPLPFEKEPAAAASASASAAADDDIAAPAGRGGAGTLNT